MIPQFHQWGFLGVFFATCTHSVSSAFGPGGTQAVLGTGTSSAEVWQKGAQVASGPCCPHRAPESRGVSGMAPRATTRL